MLPSDIKITYPTLDEVIKQELTKAFENEDKNKGKSSSSSKTMELRRGQPLDASNKRYQALLTDKSRNAQNKVQQMIDNMLLASQKDIVYDGQKWITLKNTSGIPYHNVIYEGRVERDHSKDCDTPYLCVCPPKKDVHNYGSFFFVNRLYMKTVTTIHKDTIEGQKEGITHTLISIFANRIHDVPNYRIKNIKPEDIPNLDMTTIDINDIEPIEDMSTEKGFFPWIVIDIPKIPTCREGFVPERPVKTEAEYEKRLRDHLQSLIKKYTVGKNQVVLDTNDYETIPCMIDIYSFNVIRQFNWEPLILERDLNFEGDLNTICGVLFVAKNYPNSSDQDYRDLSDDYNRIFNSIIYPYSQKIEKYSESLIHMADDIDKVVQLKNLHSNLHDIPNLPEADVKKHKMLINDIGSICDNIIGQSKSDTRISQIHTILSNIKLYSDKLTTYNNKMKKGCTAKKMDFLEKEFKKIQKKLEESCNELNIIVEDYKMNKRESKYEKTMSQLTTEIFKGSDNISKEIMKQILANDGISKLEIVPNEKFEESFKKEEEERK